MKGFRLVQKSILNQNQRSFAHALTGAKVLVAGCKGQIGLPLVHALCKEVGRENVVAADISDKKADLPCKFEQLDVADFGRYEKIVKDHKITYIVHLAAILSALGERFPDRANSVNVTGFLNAINLARDNKCKIYCPSSIAVFGGEHFPKVNTPDDVILQPETIYGVTKVFNEMLGNYYHKKFGVDFRAIRYPGVISSEKYEFNGTTDYSTQIFFEALEKGHYKCFLGPKSDLPMIYIDDCIQGTIDFLKADSTKLKRRTYNMAGISFNPEQLAASLQKLLPNFEIQYEPDFRQKIADAWPKSIDDSNAQKDWGWSYNVTVDDLAQKIFDGIDEQYKQGLKKYA
ncbi:nad-dependent epimerase [Stylonychia lemnae]|uniref:Nad-dependent epimerase n=1 Tax=Stylonychia lemnae TaxID=5949 RepID=A0A077ZTT3_STYLE|nr:nad-dependent epimerase [Stylonychia lemnae]|eukprot:CDW71851.1 nad-dependent epimerase [Stylonychia lemnae]